MLDSKRVLRFLSFSYLIFIYPHTQTHTPTHAHTYIPPIERDKLLLYSYSIYVQPHKCGLLVNRLYHVARCFYKNVFCIKVYLHTTEVVQPHQGAQQCSKPSFLPRPNLKL